MAITGYTFGNTLLIELNEIQHNINMPQKQA